MLGFVKEICYQCYNMQTFNSIYFACVRLHLEYASLQCVPYCSSYVDHNKTASVQKQFRIHVLRKSDATSDAQTWDVLINVTFSLFNLLCGLVCGYFGHLSRPLPLWKCCTTYGFYKPTKNMSKKFLINFLIDLIKCLEMRLACLFSSFLLILNAHHFDSSVIILFIEVSLITISELFLIYYSQFDFFFFAFVAAISWLMILFLLLFIFIFT